MKFYFQVKEPNYRILRKELKNWYKDLGNRETAKLVDTISNSDVMAIVATLLYEYEQGVVVDVHDFDPDYLESLAEDSYDDLTVDEIAFSYALWEVENVS